MQNRDFWMLLEQLADGALDEGPALVLACGDPRLQAFRVLEATLLGAALWQGAARGLNPPCGSARGRS